MIVNTEDELKAGTGFMLQLYQGLNYLKKLGYTENLTARFDHLECQSGKVHLMPNQFVVEGIMRFENTSDPSDQSILYAISSHNGKIKGAYVESYGLYHENLSPEMIERLKNPVIKKDFC